MIYGKEVAVEDLTKKLAELKEKCSELYERKVRLEERLKAEKKNLTNLVKKVKEKGYDPNKLEQIRKEKEEELEKKIQELEKSIEKSDKELAEIEEVV